MLHTLVTGKDESLGKMTLQGKFSSYSESRSVRLPNTWFEASIFIIYDVLHKDLNATNIK